ncbi:MAG: DUF1462 family protein [Coriobacteriales bacterium]|nr:DUF1462 family protein [Coriobacteriales bacterium]
MTAIIRAEVERRWGSDAQVDYVDVGDQANRSTHSHMVDEIENRGLLYPVTIVDGTPLYDGAVSYPAILRAINNKMIDMEGAREATGA